MILVTNDDGVDAPALPFLARQLAELDEVTVVVPASERSWIGKAISRHDPVHLDQVVRRGVAMYTCSGYPADCVQIGVHNVLDEPPDLVVSGINIGNNHGAGFLLGSGTVGATIEAWILGVPALAASVGPRERPWREWAAWARSEQADDMWLGAALITKEIVADTRRVGWPDADIVSVEIPSGADQGTPRRVTSLARIGYHGLFEWDDGAYHHRLFGRFRGTPAPGSDVAESDVVTITPVRLAETAPGDVAWARAVERGAS